MQHQRQPIMLGQFIERIAHDAGNGLFIHGGRVIGEMGFTLGRRPARVFATASRPNDPRRLPLGDALKPSHRLIDFRSGFERDGKLEKRDLRRILSIVPVVRDSIAQGINERGIAPHQLLKAVGLTGFAKARGQFPHRRHGRGTNLLRCATPHPGNDGSRDPLSHSQSKIFVC